MTDLLQPTLRDMIACAERELEYRKRMYARLTLNGEMTQAKAEWELACMQAILDNLVKQALLGLR